MIRIKFELCAAPALNSFPGGSGPSTAATTGVLT